MAKKQDFKLDSYGFDSGLDMPDFNFDGPKIKDDRKAATKIAGGVLGGFKSTIVTPSFIRDLVKKSLPVGYGSAMDLADESADTIKGLYNDAAKEIKPVIGDLKRTTKKIMPSMEGALPRSVSERIKKWAASEDKTKDMSAEEQRNASLQMQLGEIFQFQTKATMEKDAEGRAKDAIQDSIDHGRHRDNLGQLDAMRVSLQQLAGYQSKVESNYQRKSLELQFRHYFLAQDSLEEMKRHNVEAKTNLEGILKNTGLPDFVKLKATERLKEVMRNKFIDSAHDGLIGKRSMFMKNVGSKVGSVIKDKMSGFMSNVKSGIDAVDMAADMNEMRKEMGDHRSGGEVMGEMAGGALANSMGTKVGKKIRSLIPHDSAVGKFGTKLGYMAANAPQLATDWAHNSDSYSPPERKGLLGKTIGLFDSGRALGGIGDIGREAIRGANSIDNALIGDKAGSMQDPSHFSRGASKSVTEIIPGFLARIYRELQIMRTGNPNIELTTYDFSSNKFSEKSKVTKKIFEQLSGKGQSDIASKKQQIAELSAKKNLTEAEKEKLKSLKASANEDTSQTTAREISDLINEIDKDGKLSPEQRKALGQQMLNDNLKNRSGSAKRLTNAESYHGKSGKHASAFADLFSEYFKGDTTGKKQADFAGKFSKLGANVSDHRKAIQDHLNTGNRDILEELGILDEGSDQINQEKLNSFMYGDESNHATGNQTTTGLSARPNSKLNKNRRQTRQFGTVQSQPMARSAPQFATEHDEPVKQQSHNVNEELISAIKENNTKTISDTISETLLRIEKKLNEGIFTHEVSDGGEAKGAGGKGPWWNRSVKNLAKDAYGLGKKGFNSAREIASNAFSRVGNLASKVLDFGLPKAKDLLGKGIDKLKGLRDIYVKGEMGPRLLAWKLKAGHYRDQATGKIIKNYKDIKGAVIDEAGNIVLKAEEIRDSFVKSGLLKKALSTLGSAFSTAKSFGETMLGKIPPMLRFGLEMVKKAYGLLDAPQDVYTKDKPDIPALLAKTMKSGGYRSRVTGNIITKLSEIDGAILDDLGNEVLTAAEFAKGLFNSKGKPIRTGINKLVGFAKDAFGSVKNTLKKGIGFVKDGLSHLAGGISIGGFGGKHGKTMIDLVTEIRDLLKDRLPGKKKRIIGDAGGDGVRDGSYEDLLAKKKTATEGSVAGGATGILGKGKSMLGAAGAGIAGLFGKKKEKDEDGKGVGDLAEQAVADKAAGGLWGATKKLGGKALSVGKWGLGLLPGLGLGGGGAAAGAAVAGEAAAVGGAAAAGGGIMAGIGGALAGIGAFLASPVVLGAAAIAAVAIGGYFAYKYLTKKKLTTLSKVRYAQYGFLPNDDEHLQQVFGLEEILNKAISYKGGIAQLDETKIKVKDVISSMGVDQDNKQEVAQLLTWFTKRFKPIYLTHLSALNNVAPGKFLEDIEDLKPEEKRNYLMIAKFPEGPYDVTTSPFPKLSSLPAGSSDVTTAITAADAEIKDLVEKKGKGALGAAATSAAVNAPGLDKSKISDITKQNKDTSGLNGKPRGAWDTVKDVADSIGVGFGSVGAAVGGVAFNATQSDTFKGAVKGASKGFGKFGVLGGIAGMGMGAVKGFTGGKEVSNPGEGTGGGIDAVPMPSGDGTWAALKNTIHSAADMVGVDGKLMAVMAAIESGFNTTVKASTSTATGLYQFLAGTWKTMLSKYGKKYGISPDTPPTDPRANALMGAEFIKENSNALKGAVDRPLTDTDLYLAHFLGAGGAKQLLKADHSAIAATIMPGPARANPSIFYNKDNSPRTVGEVYAEINRRVRSKGKQFGLDAGTEIATLGAGAGLAVASAKTTTGETGIADAGSSNPIGKFGISDQAPGITAPSNKIVNASLKTTTAAGGSKSSNLDPDIAAASSGFVSPRARDITAQQAYQKDSDVGSLGNVGDTLKASLTVQQSQVELLTKILGVITNRPISGNGSTATDKANPNVAPPPAAKKATEMPHAPVSMSKERIFI